MFHKGRQHSIVVVESLPQLARMLADYTYTLSAGFRVGKLTLLNDSTSEDLKQEYSVQVDGEPIESLTVSDVDPEELLRLLEALEARA